MNKTANVEEGRAMQLADNLLLQYVCVLIAFKENTVQRTKQFHYNIQLPYNYLSLIWLPLTVDESYVKPVSPVKPVFSSVSEH